MNLSGRYGNNFINMHIPQFQFGKFLRCSRAITHDACHAGPRAVKSSYCILSQRQTWNTGGIWNILWSMGCNQEMGVTTWSLCRSHDRYFEPFLWTLYWNWITVTESIIITDVHYVTIMLQGLNQQYGISLPDLPNRARYVYHENACFDWGTFGWALHDPKINIQVDAYKYFIFMNSSVRGPFLPPYWPVQHYCTLTDLHTQRKIQKDDESLLIAQCL